MRAQAGWLAGVLLAGWSAPLGANGRDTEPVYPIPRATAAVVIETGVALVSGRTTSVTLYDNIGRGSQVFYAGQAREEAVDDVHGIGSGVLSSITFEYFEPDATVGSFEATISVYDNPLGLDQGIVPLLEDLLVSGLNPGLHSRTVPIPGGLEVGPDLWVGVRFTSRSAGLVIQEEPRLGSSHDYYLENGRFFYFTGDPKANFALAIGIEPEQVPVELIALNDVAQSEGVDELLRIPSQQTGVAELVGSLGTPFQNTEAMAVVFEGGQERILAIDNDHLLELDPGTGEGMVIGPVGFPDVDGIAYHAGSGTLYGVTHGSNQIVSIDTATGAGTEVASDVIVGRRLNDLAFHPDGSAYVLTGESPRVYEVDIRTGEKIETHVLSGGTSLEALLWSPDGETLYSAADRDGSKDLVTIDLETDTISFVSPESSGFPDIEALAWLTQDTAALLRNWSVSDLTVSPRFRLYQNAPNPFNPRTRIDFELPRLERVEVSIYDVRGRVVRSLFEGELSGGPHRFTWNGRDRNGAPLPSGIYLYRLRTPSATSTLRMTLLR